MRQWLLIIVLALMPIGCGDDSGEMVERPEGQDPQPPIASQPDQQPPADMNEGVQPPQTADTEVEREGNIITAAGIQFEIDPEWSMVQPESSMRIAQFELPAQEGDSEPAEMSFYANIGGSPEANIERWINQFQQPEGEPSSEVAEVDNVEVANFAVTTLDVSGTYVASPMMGGDGNQPNYRLLGAVVVGDQGPWFFKLTGPQNTVAHWESAFNNMIDSLQPAS